MRLLKANMHDIYIYMYIVGLYKQNDFTIISNGMYLSKWENQKLKHMYKRMLNNCHIPDFCADIFLCRK